MWTVPFQDNWLTVCTVELERTFIVNVNDTYIDYTFFHHHQGSIDLNTVNIHHALRMYFLIHPQGWISDERMAECTLPQVGMYWVVQCTFPPTLRFHSGLSQSLWECIVLDIDILLDDWSGPVRWHLCSWQKRCPCILLSSSSPLCTLPGSIWFSLMKWELSLKIRDFLGIFPTATHPP